MSMKKLFLTIIFYAVSYTSSIGQISFYQDIFYGGVTSGGFSTGQGFGSGTLNLYIESGSTIKKAYLFTYRQGYPPNVPITINGTPFLFDTTEIIMKVNNALPSASPIHLYYYDFTDSLSANITSTFNITIPTQSGLPINWGYWTIYIYIAYENPTLQKVATSLWINNKNFLGNEAYIMNGMNPIDIFNPVGLSLFMDRACNHTTDGTIVSLNSNNLGIIGGSDAVNNLWGCSGAKGHFYYQNNTLFGLDDDAPDNLMDSTDALADISSYILNNTTNYNLNLVHNNLTNPSKPNITPLFINAYTTPCDTFTTSITPNDTICKGETVQLNATGGASYSWFSAFSTFNDSTLANPIATPTQTTTYIVTIKNDSGCVKTEHVKIWVNPLPVADTLIVTPNNCGDSVGSLQVGNIPNGAAPFNYQLTNLQTLITQNSALNTFTNLGTGNYQLTITDNYGCQWTSDTITINETNNVVASFTANPQTGVAPLTVDFVNTSQNANTFGWFIINGLGDTIEQIPVCIGITANCGVNYTFDSIGTYQVCLISYNNIPTCADTLCQTIIIDQNEDINVFIPNLFTPNGDGKNDAFVISVFGINLLESLKAEVFNRWGMLIKSSEFGGIASSLAKTELVIWDGRTTAGAELPEGTYFYVITYTKKTGETTIEKGSLTLLR